MKPIALFDLDGSLAGYDESLERDLKSIAGPNDPELDMKNLYKIPYYKTRVHLIRNQPNWWLDLPILEEGYKIFKLAEKIGFDLHIATVGPDKHHNAWSEKLLWVKKHLGNLPVHIVSDKSLLFGHILYDDYPKYCKKWVDKNTQSVVIMPNKYYNSDFSHERVVKWHGNNIEEITELMEKTYKTWSR